MKCPSGISVRNQCIPESGFGKDGQLQERWSQTELRNTEHRSPERFFVLILRVD